MAAALPVVGSAVSAYGALQAGQSTSQALNAQADLAIQNAQEAEDKGQFDANRQMLIAGKRIGESTAAYGAAGVTESGSVVAVHQSSMANAELDRLNILHGADVRAIQYRNQAAMNRYGAESAIKGSYWQAAGYLTQGLVKTVANNQGAPSSNMLDSQGAGDAGAEDAAAVGE